MIKTSGNKPLLSKLILLSIAVVSLLPYLVLHAQTDPINEILSRMSLEERVGQLFVVRSWGKTANSSFEQLIASIHPGGVVLLNENLTDPKGITILTNGLQTLATTNGAKIPLLIMLDQEGGKIQRLRNGFTQLANPLLLGAITDMDLLQEYGAMVGSQIKAVGVNMNLAPVVDLATNPNNPVVFNRMLGNDPQRVATAARYLMKGMSQIRVVSVAKHFPGHGDVTDTHVRSGWLPHDLARLESMELYPFLNSDAPVIMMGHISSPALDPSGLPATLSSAMVSYLREHNYNNVIMSDAMDMAAISNYFSSENAAVTAINAGIDLILLGAHPQNTAQISIYTAVLNAARNGEISEARINNSVRRILKLKASHNLLDWMPLSVEQADSRIAKADGDAILSKVYMVGMTLVRNSAEQIPLKQGQHVALMFPSVYSDIGRLCSEVAQPMGIEPELMPFEYNPVNWQLGQASALAAKVDVSVVFIENVIQNANQYSLVEKLPSDRTIIVAMGDPDHNSIAPDIAGYLLAYDATPPSFSAACGVLFGKVSPTGILPLVEH